MAPLSLREGGFRLAAWSSMPDAGVVDALLRAPFGAIVLDMQHGLHDIESVQRAVTLAAAFGKPAIVRVPVASLPLVSRVLDFGASGVILPMIETAEDVRAFVEVAKYPPLGRRSFGPTRAAQIFGDQDGAAYMREANERTLAIAMIETQRAVDDLDAILSVEGVDGVLVGPSDLSIALFGRLDPGGPETARAAAHIARSAKAAGKFASIYAGDAEAVRRAREQGYDLAGLSSDAALLGQAFASAAAAAMG